MGVRPPGLEREETPIGGNEKVTFAVNHVENAEGKFEEGRYRERQSTGVNQKRVDFWSKLYHCLEKQSRKKILGGVRVFWEAGRYGKKRRRSGTHCWRGERRANTVTHIEAET